jgi:hypothetical protein
MPQITKNMLLDAVATMPPIFDTHAIIEEIQRSNPQSYTRDLYRFVNHRDPFVSLHAEIGRRLLTIPALQKTRKVQGRNVRAGNSLNQQWRKN